MHPLIIFIGLILVLMLFVHIVFRVVKFTLMIFILGLGVVAVLYIFQHAFGIDLMQVVTGIPMAAPGGGPGI